MMGAFIGGTVSEISGGNFEEGFATGLTVSALNHSLHALSSYSNNYKVTTGNIKFENLTDDEFEYFRVIPEHGTDKLIRPSMNNKFYYGDGLYIDPRNVPLHGASDYWFKVSAGASLYVKSTKFGYEFNYTKSSSMQYIAKLLKKPYRVGFRPYSDGGSGFHGSSGGYRNPFHKYFSNN